MLRKILKNFCKIFCFHDWEKTRSDFIIRIGDYYRQKYNIDIYKKCKKCGAEKAIAIKIVNI